MDAQHDTAPIAVQERPRARTSAPRARTGPRPVPVVRSEYAHLGLDALRAYRTALQGEESNVSYWRRIIQARLDVVRDGRTAGGTVGLSAEHLRPVLDSGRVRAGRTALVQVLPVDDIPPLPDLAELWARQVPEADPEALAGLEADLDRAEKQLSAYRTALHGRLGDATGELIARYRAQPGLCLSVLPLPAPRSA